jgi:HK97 gp10 family phage protein
MAKEVSITIKNMAQIRAAFNKAPQLMTRELNKAIPKAVLVVKRQSMINTPVLTGRLRASHKTTYSNLKGTIFPSANYGLYVHEGTKFMQARPFLADAVESEDSKIQGYFVKAVDNVLSSIGKAT